MSRGTANHVPGYEFHAHVQSADVFDIIISRGIVMSSYFMYVYGNWFY
jgi:hypothetical protein